MAKANTFADRNIDIAERKVGRRCSESPAAPSLLPTLIVSGFGNPEVGNDFCVAF